MVILGSARLASSLLRRGLVDKYRVIAHPVIAGSGKPLFQNFGTCISPALVGSRPMK
jgi:dihydrofolate reductase